MSSASPSEATTVPTAVWFSAASNVAAEVNVGAAFVAVAVTLAASVAGAMPSVPPRGVTVRVKVSSVPAVSAGIVTSGVALAASSNVTVTPLAGSVSAQP